MTATRTAERARTLTVVIAVAAVGLAIGLGLFIAAIQRDLHPPEDVPRAIAIPALYVAIGLLALVSAYQRRPLIVAAAGGLCLIGMILSVATVVFLVPGIVLLILAARSAGEPGAWRRSEVLVAVASVVLTVSAAIALLALTQSRCWQATGSPANPTYQVIPCSAGPVTLGPDGAFASGYDSGELTVAGGLVEAGLLGGMLALVVLTGRYRAAG